jgi:superfamily I DNA/RNA helicase
VIDLCGLNDKQRKAAETIDGPVLILAGAGSGKTRTVTYRIAHMVDNLKIDTNSILAISFTNKAAKEMSERVRGLLGYKKRRGLTLSTFHSLGLKILRTEITKLGYNKNFTIYDTADQLSIIREALKQFRAEKAFDRKIIQSKISFLKNNGIDAEEYATSRFFDETSPYDIATEYCYHFYKEKLQFYNAVDFDDILFLSVKVFREYPDVAKLYSEKFKYIMIDEYQDTNGLQFEMVRGLTSTHSNICVVGDDDQAIYAFRGADITNILNFEKVYSNTTIIKLEQNYRSTTQILDLANKVIKENKKRKDKTLWSTDESGNLPTVWATQDTKHEATVIVDEINKLQAAGVHLSDVAILYRSNNQIPPIEDELIFAQLPYDIIGGQKLYEKKEIKDLIAYLTVIFNPKDEIALRRILNVPHRGIGMTTLKKLLDESLQLGKPLFEIIKTHSHDDDRKGKLLNDFVDLIDKYQDKFKSAGLENGLNMLLNEIGYYEFVAKSYDSVKAVDRKKAEINNFLDTAGKFEDSFKDEANIKSFLEKILLADSQDTRNNRDEDGRVNQVTLMTLHSSKGLEYDNVFLIGMEEDKLPHQKVIKNGEDVAEERRLCYVGMTRARRKLYMTFTKQTERANKKYPKFKTRFLMECEDHYIEQDRTKFEHLTDDEAATYKQEFFDDLLKSLQD